MAHGLLATHIVGGEVRYESLRFDLGLAKVITGWKYVY